MRLSLRPSYSLGLGQWSFGVGNIEVSWFTAGNAFAPTTATGRSFTSYLAACGEIAKSPGRLGLSFEQRPGESVSSRPYEPGVSGCARIQQSVQDNLLGTVRSVHTTAVRVRVVSLLSLRQIDGEQLNQERFNPGWWCAL